MVDQFLEEERREVEASAPVPSSRAMRHTLVAVLSLVCLTVWFAPYPTLVSKSDGAQAARDLAEIEEASARARLYFAAQSVEHFRVTHGRLPRSLSEAGVARDSSIEYRPSVDSIFSLSVRAAPISLSYDSRTTATGILGRSEDVIAGRGH